MSQVARINPQSQSATTRERLSARTRILIVDHDQSTAVSLTMLPNINSEVVQVTDSDKAYRLLCLNNNFDALVLNPSVKGIGGLDLLRYMKSEKQLKRIPVVVVVGDDQSRLVRDSFAAGAIACLNKPLTGELLWRTLTMVLPPDAAKKKAA